MSPTVRLANEADLPAVAAIAGRGRKQRAEWEPVYFRASAGADEKHEAHLAELIRADHAVVRVVCDETEVVGCAIAQRHGDQWFVDDVATADEGWWSDAMIELLRAVKERPAFTCVLRKDIRQLGCLSTLGLRHRTSHWRLANGEGATADGVAAVAAPEGLPAPPPHGFEPLDPQAADVTVLGDGAGGYAVLSSPVAAPPVYDPGGTTGLVDRVTGGQRGVLVDAAMAESLTRGDAQLVVVCAEDDVVLEDALVDRGFARVVDVYSWPRRPS